MSASSGSVAIPTRLVVHHRAPPQPCQSGPDPVKSKSVPSSIQLMAELRVPEPPAFGRRRSAKPSGGPSSSGARLSRVRHIWRGVENPFLLPSLRAVEGFQAAAQGSAGQRVTTRAHSQEMDPGEGGRAGRVEPSALPEARGRQRQRHPPDAGTALPGVRRRRLAALRGLAAASEAGEGPSILTSHPAFRCGEILAVTGIRGVLPGAEPRPHSL